MTRKPGSVTGKDGMFSKVKEIEERFNEIETELARPEVIRDQKIYQKYLKEHSNLFPIISAYRKYESIQKNIEDNRSLLEDPDAEIRKLAKEEVDVLKTELDRTEGELKVLLLPEDPNDQKNIILEIRAGTGGEEAALFAADLFKMYAKYAELKGWKSEIMSEHTTGIGGFKEII
ncbi:MAG: PCRF domain-containing protein, partial [Deltaproteobacteria bacterium]